MKRPGLILIGGLLLAVLAYGVSYFAGSRAEHCRLCGEASGLKWLQTEFHLSDTEFARAEELHEQYAAACAERCRRIDAKNAELENLLASANNITPEIDLSLQEAAQLRAECQKAMLEHFYEVSRTMPPEQGRRYLAWVIARTLGTEGSAHAAMTGSASATHEHHHK